MRHALRSVSMIALMAGAAPVLAQQGPPPAPSAPPPPAAQGDDLGDPMGDDIVVQAGPPPGQVKRDVKPELVLNPADIRAYGANSISDLLDDLAPQTGGIRGRSSGRPVILLDGRRISGFQEIRDLPTEAILRIDILPEEAALAYGYRADQKVVNIVLRPRFRSHTIDLDNRVPGAGGTDNFQAEAGMLRINKAGRLNVDLQYQRNSPLFESERDLVSSRAGGVYDVTGNILPASGASQVDPALSLAAGQTVTIAGVPLSAAGGGATLGDFVPTANRANVTDTTPYRTLKSASDRFAANAVLNRTVFGDVSATGSLRFELTQSRGYQGLAGEMLDLPAADPYSPFTTDTRLARYAADTPLLRDGQSWTGNAGIALNGDIDPKWRWSLNTTYDRSQTITRTDRGVDGTALQAALDAGDPAFNPFGPLDALDPLALLTDYARSISSEGAVDALVAGTPFTLPAGGANLSVRVKLDTLDYSTRSIRSGVLQTGGIGRDSATVRTSLSLPIADADKGVLSPLGKLSISGDAEYEHLSDFGGLWTLGSTLNWTPAKPVRLLVSYTHEQGAPSPQQLGDPTIVTPNATIFDYVRGQSVEVTRIDGGNPLLTRDKRSVFKAGLMLQPIKDTDFRITADYVRSILRDSAASFPTPTAEIEAAFPGRFVRDADGRLLSVDARPVNLAESRSQQLRIGFNFSKPIQSNLQKRIDQFRASGGDFSQFRRGRDAAGASGGASGSAAAPQGGQDGAKPDAAGQGGAPAPDAARDGGGRGGGGRGGGFGRRGNFDARGRIQLSLYYTLELENSILIRDGVPRLDLLNGSASGGSGGQPRHTLQFRGGATRDGIGFRINADYKSATHVDGGTSGGQRLDFGDLATVDLRFFMDLTAKREWVRAHPWMRGMRVTFGIDNIFDAHQRVTDSTGVVPLSYQPGYVDPLGRTFRISIRKLFFPNFSRRTGPGGRGG